MDEALTHRFQLFQQSLLEKGNSFRPLRCVGVGAVRTKIRDGSVIGDRSVMAVMNAHDEPAVLISNEYGRAPATQ